MYGLTPDKIYLFRNLRSSLAIVADTTIQESHMMLLPVVKRPPRFRYDHWRPLVVFDRLSTEQVTTTMEKVREIENQDTPEHKLAVLSTVLNFPNLRASWEWLSRKDSELWPADMVHVKLRQPVPMSVFFLEQAWKDNSFLKPHQIHEEQLLEFKKIVEHNRKRVPGLYDFIT